MNFLMKTQRGALAVLVIAICVAAPLFVYPVFLMKALCFALFACAFNLLTGYGGLMSFGHAAFFGSASYVAAYLLKSVGAPPEVALLAGTASGALLGLVMGWLSIRRVGIYFSMVTLALSQIVFFYALRAPWTGGEDGIQAVPRGVLFGLIDLENSVNLYYVVLVIFVAGFALIYRTIHSPFGQVLRGIRENEARVISLGYKVNRYKLLAFVLSAGLTGLAGATKVVVFQLATLTDVSWAMSGEVVLMVLVGGMGTVFGPVVGAFVLVGMGLYLAQFGAWVTVIQGVIFVVCVLSFRNGLVGSITDLVQRQRSKKTQSLEEAPVRSTADLSTKPLYKVTL